MKPTLCIYHGSCADGFGAAWAVWKAKPDTEFYAARYQEPPPDVTGRNVMIVDFSYKRDVLLRMAQTADTILIIDHHKTAAEDLKDLPEEVVTGSHKCLIDCVFDMDRSGAMLTWNAMHPTEEPPQLIRHIQDRDLWRFDLFNTRAIQAALFSYPYDFAVWDKLMSASTQELSLQGVAIERKHFKDLKELLPVCTRPMKIGGYDVMTANLPYTFASDAGHALLETNPFGVTYYDGPNGRNFSLRSQDGGVDVSEIAKLYGGGGHRNAAGFKLSFSAAAELEVP